MGSIKKKKKNPFKHGSNILTKPNPNFQVFAKITKFVKNGPICHTLFCQNDP